MRSASNSMIIKEIPNSDCVRLLAEFGVDIELNPMLELPVAIDDDGCMSEIDDKRVLSNRLLGCPKERRRNLTRQSRVSRQTIIDDPVSSVDPLLVGLVRL